MACIGESVTKLLLDDTKGTKVQSSSAQAKHPATPGAGMART
jgi:hypothetical protein